MFLSYLSNGEESEKRDHGEKKKKQKKKKKKTNEKIKKKKIKGKKKKNEAAVTTFAGTIRARPAVAGWKFYRRGRLVVLLLPGWRVYSGGGRNRLPRLKPDDLKIGQKNPVRVFWFLGFSLEFWGWILTWHLKLGLYRA